VTQPTKDYNVTGQVHLNNLNADGTVTPGWQVTVMDTKTQTSIPVFVPDTNYTPEGVDIMVRHVLERVRAVHQLGEQ
jgi:hypothetical protein